MKMELAANILLLIKQAYICLQYTFAFTITL